VARECACIITHDDARRDNIIMRDDASSLQLLPDKVLLRGARAKKHASSRIIIARDA
jgi:hypothetical protein